MNTKQAAQERPPHRTESGWWFEINGSECGPYDTRSEAEKDRSGLRRFYRDHPEYIETERNARHAAETVTQPDNGRSAHTLFDVAEFTST